MKIWRLPGDTDGPRGLMDAPARCTGCGVTTWMAILTVRYVAPCCDRCFFEMYDTVPDERRALPRSGRCDCGAITGLGAGGVAVCDSCDLEARRTEGLRIWLDELADRRRATTA